MARVWYSVFGEGYGHSTRSEIIIKKLQKNHTLMITGFNKSYKYLKNSFPKITHKIEGPGFVYDKNEVAITPTILNFLNNLSSQTENNFTHIFNLIKKFKPDVLVSDFEPASHYMAYLLNIPIIEIDNMSLLEKCDVDYKPEDTAGRLMTETVLKAFNPYSNCHLIFTLKKYPIKEKNVFLYPPIIRKQIKQITPQDKKHILIYQTQQKNFLHLIPTLKKMKTKFIFYGLNQSKTDGNIQYKKFSKTGFVEDMGSCSGIIMNGGFSTISEAVHLKKPMLIVPATNQYEQKFNAITVKDLKFGDYTTSLNQKAITNFLSKIEYYKKNLNSYKPQDESLFFKKLESTINNLTKKPNLILNFVIKIEKSIRPKKYERTLTILKPDTLEQKNIGEVIKRLEKQGVKPVAMKMVRISKLKAKWFYKDLKDKVPKSVHKSVIDYMTSGNVIAIVWQGPGVVNKVRQICGPTNPKDATEKQIRSLSKEDMKKQFKKGKAVRNVIHSSASIPEAKREINYFFMPWEIKK